jgi:hypothetical protein
MSEAILGIATDWVRLWTSEQMPQPRNAGIETQRTMTARSQCIGGAEGKGVWGSD